MEEKVKSYLDEHKVEYKTTGNDTCELSGCKDKKEIKEYVIPSKIIIDDKKYSVTSIGSCAFQGCRNLMSVVIPASVTQLGYGIFYECENITIEIDEANKNYKTKDGSIYSKDGTTLVQYYGAISSEFEVPSVNKIGAYAFYQHPGLTSQGNMIELTIPSSVKEICEYAFQGCTMLKKVSMECVETIGKGAFAKCYNDFPNNKAKFEPVGLTEVELPNSIKRISASAFAENKVLTMLIGLKNEVDIGDYAFFNCRRLCCFNEDDYNSLKCETKKEYSNKVIMAHGQKCIRNQKPRSSCYSQTAFSRCICLEESVNEENMAIKEDFTPTRANEVVIEMRVAGANVRVLETTLRNKEEDVDLQEINDLQDLDVNYYLGK